MNNISNNKKLNLLYNYMNNKTGEEIFLKYKELQVDIKDDIDFLFHDNLTNPEILYFLKLTKNNIKIEYNSIFQNIIKKISPNVHVFYKNTNTVLIESLSIISKLNFFNNNYEYNYRENINNKTNTLDIFLKNDINLNDISLNKLPNLNYIKNLIFIFENYFNNGNLEDYIKINYNNIYKSGFFIPLDDLLMLIKKFNSKQDLNNILPIYYEKHKIKNKIEIKDSHNYIYKRL